MIQAEKLKKTLEDEIENLRNRVCGLESNYKSKCEESAVTVESKELALSAAMAEVSRLKDEIAEKLLVFIFKTDIIMVVFSNKP